MKLGSTVRLTYTGTLDDGTVFGYAKADDPMEFQTGMDLVIDGLEKEILEMNEVGEKRTFTISCYDAYGEYLEENFQKVPLENLPMKVSVGTRVWMLDENNQKFPTTCTEITDNHAVLDMNHPLAGKDLTFEVELVGLEDAPENFVSAKEKAEKIAEQNRAMGLGGSDEPNTIML